LLVDDTTKVARLVTKISRLGQTVRGFISSSEGNVYALLDDLRPTLDNLRAADDKLVPTFKSLIRFGKLFDRAAPGDYVNISGVVIGLLNSKPALPNKHGEVRSSTATRVALNRSDAVRALLGGGGR
jgi:hypothetical protein